MKETPGDNSRITSAYISELVIGEAARRQLRQRIGIKQAVDNIRRLETALIFGLILVFVIVSRLFIYSFRHIPLTSQAGGEELLYSLVGGAALAFSISTLPLLVVYLTVLFGAERVLSEHERGYGSVLLPAALFLV